jgi:GT2 family glycosyltransferase
MKNYDMNDLVSIIIVNYNGKSHLEKCLDSLSKIDYPRYEIILVDNNSTDGSLEFVKSHYSTIRIIKLDHNYGFAEPNNIAAKIANGNYLMFLNNDTVVQPDFIHKLVQEMKLDPMIAISQSMLLKPGGDVDSSGDYIDSLGRAYSARDRPNEIRPILSAKGAAMMIRKNIFCKLGGFDKNFFATFEDVDIGWRSWLLGYKVVLIPNSVVYHTGGQTIREISSLIRFHGVKNTLVLRLTNFEIYYGIKSMFLLFFVSLMRKTIHISVIKDPEESPPLPSFKIILKGIYWILKNYKYVLLKRKEINSQRVVSTNDLIKKNIITNIYFNFKI